MLLLKITLILLLIFLTLQTTQNYTSYNQTQDSYSFPTFQDFAKALKYPVQVHKINTEDGYILTFFRLQKKHQNSFIPNLPVIYLQHGFMDSGDTWIIDNESNAPGFLLANLGYDVWVGNSRGTKYSLEHITLHKNDAEFWQFSWQNMSRYDLPAAFEYINKITNQKINYIGHSQGTTIMFAALSERDPIVLKYLRKYIALAPVAWVANIKSGPMKLMAHSILAKIVQQRHMNQFFPANFWESDFGHLFCRLFANECGNFLKFLVGADPKYDNPKQFNLILEHEPGGTSVMNALHWRQEVLSGKFDKFDYGIKGNLMHYNQTTPPLYNVSNINVPVYMFFGSEDSVVSEIDTDTLLKNLSGAPHVRYKEYPAGHITYIWSKDISFYFDDLLEILNESDDYETELTS